MGGWIKLHRQLLGSAVFDNEKMLKVFVWCMLKATHQEYIQIVGRQQVKLYPGQFVTGRIKAGLELGMKSSTAWDYLLLLKTAQTINIKSNNKYSVVSVENWELYQSKEDIPDSKPDSETDSKPTANQHKQEQENKKNINIEQFEEIWKLYPRKLGKAIAMKKLPNLINQYGYEQMIRTVARYKAEVKGKDVQFIQHGKTFFTSGFMDYLDKDDSKQTTKPNQDKPKPKPKAISYDERIKELSERG